MSTLRRIVAPATILTCLVSAPALAGNWANFANETSTRLPTSLNTPALSTSDPEEKDYAWADLDQDGDLDIVVVRKQPFTSAGKEPNVIFMNEGTAEGHAVNGVFVDRTSQYATDSDVGGDNGFLTPTNDRDVVLVDVDNDGWVDMVTATTLTDNQAKHLSHPRVYMNKGEIGGVWQGFRYEDARIPLMHPTAGPRFCSVAAGDVTGDGYADLYFGDYDSGGAQIFDYNNKLLINDGNGFFTDESNARLTSEMRLSAFGAASVIADINQDGVQDVVKQTSLNAPTHIAVTYNNPSNEGVFNNYDTIYGNSPYFVTAGDLNGNGRLDLVITDDGTDRVLINNGATPYPDWTSYTLPSSSSQFGGDSKIADLDNDGDNDIIITDVDVDIPGCSRRTVIYENNGANPPSWSETEIIPFSMLAGTHDIAVFDINNDGWLDMFIGRCNSTEVWMNQPPVAISFSYPNGRPDLVAPGVPTDIDVVVTAIGGTVTPGSARIHYSVDGGAFQDVAMTAGAANAYVGQIPAADCASNVKYFVSAELDGGFTATDPLNAPASTYSAISAEGFEITLRDNLEDDTSSWTVINEAGLSTGGWEVADPNGTINGSSLAAPEDDASSGPGNVNAFVTENGPVGGTAGANDVDGGPTRLLSPVIDLAGKDGTISYARWFYCDEEGVPGSEDFLVVEVTNDGSSWTVVENVAGTDSSWIVASFVVGDYVMPTASVQVRFSVSDQTSAPQSSIVEAGIDNFEVEEFVCGDISTCTTDLNGDGSTGFSDLNQLLGVWGACPGCPEDLNGDGSVGFADLNDLLGQWGACP